MKFVSIIIGSKSDYDVMKSCADTLETFGVQYELIISSAHRSPERTKAYILEAEAKGAQVFIAAAGMAAHL
ncbi:MAG: AIR carboxylase family protein, partial [Campylobacterales bacterium]|nr:AIR carboxylase family protein [Campylobacterales bacterium]